MTDLDKVWALARIEDAVDGALPASDRRRLRAVADADSEVREALDRARALRRRLRSLRGKSPPMSLLVTLWRLPERPPFVRRRRVANAVGSWSSAAVAAVAVAAVVTVLVRAPATPPADAALREFELAMTYLGLSYEVAGRKVLTATERGLPQKLPLRRADDNGG